MTSRPLCARLLSPRPLLSPLVYRPLFSRPLIAGGLVAAALAGVPAAYANDRPFQVARTAVAEDDEQVWSFESWVQRYGKVRGISFEPEYVFTSSTSVQVELTRLLDRADEETGTEAEVELKYLGNDIARDGYGWGVSFLLSAEHETTSGRTLKTIGMKLPLSIEFAESLGHLHVNGGIAKTTDERRAWSISTALDYKVTSRSVAFAEWAREGDFRFAQAGVRYWLRRERLAIDFSLQQQKSDGRRGSGFIVGVGWYDF